MPKTRNQPQQDLNETQKMIVRELFDGFLTDPEEIAQLQQRIDLLFYLRSLEKIALQGTIEDDSILIKFWELGQQKDYYLLGFSLSLNQVLQPCLGRWEQLKLHLTGGWLTESQERSLRHLTAELLQQSIEQIEALTPRAGQTLGQ